MKKLVMCLMMVSIASVASAKNFKTSGSSNRNPAQTGNVGPADVKPLVPATVECRFLVNGSNGPVQNIKVNITGSEATGDLQAEAKAALGENTQVHMDVGIRQVFKTTYASTVWVTDEVTGVQSLAQDFLEFPAVTQEVTTSAILLFSKNPRTISMNGKKITLNNVQATCSLVRNATM